jgi:hypothetical protein
MVLSHPTIKLRGRQRKFEGFRCGHTQQAGGREQTQTPRPQGPVLQLITDAAN